MILARALILSLLASAAYGGKPANNLGLCSAQKDCIDFTIKKSETFTCQPEDDCPLEVCLILDTTKEGCAKEGPISHLCAASNADGCAAYDADGVTPLTGKGVFTDCGLTGLDGSIAFDGKCEPSEEQTKIVMCQEGLPGTTLYWALKDGSVVDFASYDYTGTFTFVNEDYGEKCSPKIECTGDSGYECANPNNDMFELTRVWKYYIPPKDGTPCDMCTPPPPPPLPPEEEEEGQGKGGKGGKGAKDGKDGKDATGATEPKNNLGTCSAQKDCIDFTIKKSDSSSCALSGSCGIEVCMILDTDKEGCAKDGPISHLCAASDSNGCAAYDATGNALTGKGDSSDCNLTGEDASAAFDGKCEPTSNKVVMCQEGEPGATLYWALKDASVVDSGSYDYTGVFTFEKDSTKCSPEIECTGDAGLQCADPNNGMYELTRVWKYTIPDGGACDLCDAADPIVDSPFDVVSPTDPEEQLAEMPNVIIENQDNLDSETFMDEDSETFDELPESEKIGEDPTPPEDTAEDPVEEPETPETPETPVIPAQSEDQVEEPVTPEEPEAPSVDEPAPVVEEPVSEEDPAVDPTKPADLEAPETPPAVDEASVEEEPEEPETPVEEPVTPEEPEAPSVDEPAPVVEEPVSEEDPAVDPTKSADLETPETPETPPAVDEPSVEEEPAEPETPVVDEPVTPEDPEEPAVEQPASPDEPETPIVDEPAPEQPAPAEEPEEPASAEDPETPVNPAVDPTKPADLETPADPETPTVDEPVTPEEPEQPIAVQPASPDEPETPIVDGPPQAEEPQEPASAEDPETPVNPAVDPTKPADLETPADPETPTVDEPATPAEEPPANDPPDVDPTAVAGLGNANDAAEEPAKEAGSQGDPHFKTWRNEHYEYHGQCDMVLVKDPNFADGLGLDVQIRTKLVRFWSYIQSAAIRIGNDVFEIQGSADGATFEDVSYWVNFQYLGPIKTLGGFPIQVQSHQKAKKQVIYIDLSSKYPGSKIEFQIWKEFVKVDFIQPTAAAFGNTVGMLGDFSTGKTLARDGASEIHNFSELGNEWQVMPADYMLFHDTAKPQFPAKCIEPEDPRGARRRRRLDESSVSYEQAEKACGKLTDALDRKDCVYDIIATQDMTMVGAY